MDRNNLQKTIQQNAAAGIFGMGQVIPHTHNGIDSPLLDISAALFNVLTAGTVELQNFVEGVAIINDKRISETSVIIITPQTSYDLNQLTNGYSATNAFLLAASCGKGQAAIFQTQEGFLLSGKCNYVIFF